MVYVMVCMYVSMYLCMYVIARKYTHTYIIIHSTYMYIFDILYSPYYIVHIWYPWPTAWGFVILSERFSLFDFGLPVTFRMPRCDKCVTITRLNTCGDGFRRCGWKCRGSAAWQWLGLASSGTAVRGCVLLYGVILWFMNRLDYTLFAIRTLSRLKLWCCTCM